MPRSQTPFEDAARPATKKKPAKKTKTAPPPKHALFSPVSGTLAWGILLSGLALATANLNLMTMKTGSLDGLRQSWGTLTENYASRKSATGVAAVAEEKTEPVVLRSVARYRDAGEKEMIDEKLVAPLAAYYSAEDPSLEAVLIERRQPGSKDVQVRLFFMDGTEQAYLWPARNFEDGWWIPPCQAVREDGEVDPEKAICPGEFLEQFPDIAELLQAE